MDLTDKSTTSARSASQRPTTGVSTIIGEECTVEGKIVSKGNLRIDGSAEGEIHADDTVVIGPGGKVEGNVEARTVIIGGTIMGNVKVSEKLEIQPQGAISGDMHTPYGRLIIEEGARIEGNLTMTKDISLDKEIKAAKPSIPPSPSPPTQGSPAPAEIKGEKVTK
ncbi:polymer-forming cytoskeletal protein [Candidatus Sumerlaeota bacterium]|nr:polymer-forming cytoskeletal protein [Candidatus Sumerlaeota bacterium]